MKKIPRIESIPGTEGQGHLGGMKCRLVLPDLICPVCGGINTDEPPDDDFNYCLDISCGNSWRKE